MKEYPYWWEAVPNLKLKSQKSEVRTEAPLLPARVDVAIIGAGYTGLSAARHLARTGASVVVLEREDVGWGASSRNGGQVLTGLKLDPATLVERYGESAARRLFDASIESIERLETLIASEAIDCGYRRSGHVHAACKASHFEGLREEQALLARVFGHRVEIVPRSEQRSELGSDAYHGLLVDERSGSLDPARYVQGLAEAAARAGATVVTATPVERVTPPRAGAKHWRVATSIGEVEATDVLMATNGYTNGALPALQRRFVPVGSYIITTEPLPDQRAMAILPTRRMAFDSRHFLHYFRVTDDRRLLFGGRAEFSRPAPDTTHRAADILRRDMLTVFPELSAVAIDYAWGGNVAFTRDELPHAGRLDGAYYAGGYAGHGIAMATTLGELVARRIAGEPIDHPLMNDRFSAIPFYNGRPWFLPLVGMYYRLLDAVD
ncbi:MAG: FAD-binding oxidoreductase [Vicinamibacterales bacterium]